MLKLPKETVCFLREFNLSLMIFGDLTVSVRPEQRHQIVDLLLQLTADIRGHDLGARIQTLKDHRRGR